MNALVSGGARYKWYKTPATKNRSHEAIIKFSPIVVDCVRRGAQEHP